MSTTPESIHLEDWIRDIPDFPQRGILFKDITPLLQDATAFHAALDRLQRPVHREARADEDDRVDPRHEDGKLVPRGRPRLAVRHTDEEVGREERAEEHHLGGDEEEHPERARVDARALVRLGRMTGVGFGLRAHT